MTPVKTGPRPKHGALAAQAASPAAIGGATRPTEGTDGTSETRETWWGYTRLGSPVGTWLVAGDYGRRRAVAVERRAGGRPSQKRCTHTTHGGQRSSPWAGLDRRGGNTAAPRRGAELGGVEEEGRRGRLQSGGEESESAGESLEEGLASSFNASGSLAGEEVGSMARIWPATALCHACSDLENIRPREREESRESEGEKIRTAATPRCRAPTFRRRGWPRKSTKSAVTQCSARRERR